MDQLCGERGFPAVSVFMKCNISYYVNFNNWIIDFGFYFEEPVYCIYIIICYIIYKDVLCLKVSTAIEHLTKNLLQNQLFDKSKTSVCIYVKLFIFLPFNTVRGKASQI